MDNEQDLNLNKLLICPKEVIEPYCGGYSTCWDPNELIDIFLSDSANFLLISKWEADCFKIGKQDLPEIYQNRIIIVDENKKIFKKIQTIVKEINDNTESDSSDSSLATTNFHLTTVFKFLYNFHLGITYESDIDFSPKLDRLEDAINYLKQRSKSKNNNIYLNQISRLWNLYSIKKLNCPIYLPDSSKTSIMVPRFFEDSNYVYASHERNNLALSWNLRKLSDINLEIKRFCLSHPKLLKIGRFGCVLLPEKGPELLSGIKELFESSQQFCPSIIDTDLIIFNSIKKTALSFNYDKNTLERMWSWKEIEQKWWDGPGYTLGPVDAYFFKGSPLI
jgi:hypothetical protein